MSQLKKTTYIAAASSDAQPEGETERERCWFIPRHVKTDWCSYCFPGLIGNRLKFMLMSADISPNSLHSIKERSKGPKSRLFSQAIPPVKFKRSASAARLSFKTCTEQTHGGRGEACKHIDTQLINYSNIHLEILKKKSSVFISKQYFNKKMTWSRFDG